MISKTLKTNNRITIELMFETEINQYMKKHGLEAFTPKAVLFDMDGVLYDSMPNHAKSWHESMAKFGLDMAQEEAYTYEGMRGVETIKLLAKRQWGRDLSDDEAAKMYEKKSEAFRACPKAEKMADDTEVEHVELRGGIGLALLRLRIGRNLKCDERVIENLEPTDDS